MNILHRNSNSNKSSGRKFVVLFISAIMISTTSILQSCEDVIQLNLPNSGPQIVINGSISNFSDSVKVKITMTTDYFTPTAITPVTNAEVSISDNAGNVYQLTGKPDGTYFIRNLAGVPERTYTLNVKANGNQYTATSQMPGLVTLDSLAIQYDVNRQGGKVQDGILCFLKDPPGIANYYMTRVYKNDTLFTPSNGYTVNNDKYFDGKSTNIRVGLRRVKISPILPDDKIMVQLIGIDRATYEYFNVLRDILEQSGILSASTPANPPNNLNNGALGYFSAWVISERTLVVE